MLFIAILSFGFLSAAWLVQILVWRWHPPRNHFIGLLAVFSSFLVIGVITLLLVSNVGSFLCLTYLHFVQFLLCYGLLSLSYISFYSLIEGDSPSITMVMAVRKSGSKGLPIKELVTRFSNKDVVGIRLLELERDGMIAVENHTYRLTGAGMLFARLFEFGRRLLGLPKGG